MINSSLTDDADIIMKQTRSLYAMAYMIVRKCSERSMQ